MTLSDVPRMMISSHSGWSDLERIHPSVVKLFLFLVLPMSLVPPAMIEYAGVRYGAEYFGTVGGSIWLTSAAIFLVAELLTVPLMAWAIKSIAKTRDIETNFHDTFVVAAIAAVPLWLSALVLLVPSPMLVVGVALLGLIAAASVMYHGITALLHMHEQIEVATITYTTISLGIAAWFVLMALIFLPLLALTGNNAVLASLS